MSNEEDESIDRLEAELENWSISSQEAEALRLALASEEAPVPGESGIADRLSISMMSPNHSPDTAQDMAALEAKLRRWRVTALLTSVAAVLLGLSAALTGPRNQASSPQPLATSPGDRTSRPAPIPARSYSTVSAAGVRIEPKLSAARQKLETLTIRTSGKRRLHRL